MTGMDADHWSAGMRGTITTGMETGNLQMNDAESMDAVSGKIRDE